MSNYNQSYIFLSNFEHAVPYSITDKEIVRATRENKLGDGFCCWYDHIQETQDVPELKDNEILMVTFWPNNPYNERRAKQRNMSVNDFIEMRFRQICNLQKRYGDCFLWCIGWVIFQSRTWCDKRGLLPKFSTPQQGFDFYKKRLTTSLHNLGFRNALKFGEARFNNCSSTIEYLKKREIGLKDFNIVIGDTAASRAHHAFEALPDIKAFWWECGITSVCLQVGIPFVRGTIRQYKKKWIADVSSFSYPYPLHEDKYYDDLGEWGFFEGGLGKHARLNFPKYTPDMVRLGGYSPEMLLRVWLTALMGGCSFLFQEASSLSHFVKVNSKLKLTPVGKAAKKLVQFNRRINRGKPYTPVTLFLDQYHGIEPYSSPQPWGFMEITRSAHQVSAFFETAYPRHSQFPLPFPWKNLAEYGLMLRAGFDYRPYERHLLCPGRWPDIFDVTLTDAQRSAFEDSKIIIALGPHNKNRVNEKMLRTLIEEGRTFVYTAGLGMNLEFLPSENSLLDGERTFECDCTTGRKYAVKPYRVYRVKPDNWEVILTTGQSEPLLIRKSLGKGKIYLFTGECGLTTEGNMCTSLNHLLDQLITNVVPFKVHGEPIQWLVNHTDKGYLVMLINNSAKSWWGEVVWRGATIKDIHERWKEQSVVWQTTKSGAIVKLGVPCYESRILEFIL